MNHFTDKDLGTILIKRNRRAKRIIARRKTEMIILTVPMQMKNEEIKSHFKSLKPKLLSLPVKKIIEITEGTRIHTFSFEINIKRIENNLGHITSLLKNRVLIIFIPIHLNIINKQTQTIIRDLIIEALRVEAKRILPPKVLFFAKKWSLEVNQIKINSSKKRWGSCSSSKNINLSLFLLMLPEHLIDYVILHELTHTLELNHGANFWKLLDIHCNGIAKSLDKESRNYTSPHLEFLKSYNPEIK